MEPVTHLLTGACLSRTGLNRRAAYATLAMVIAAELPDIDTLWSLRGPVVGLQHHRGITHTFLGVPFEAAIVVAAIYGLHRWRVHREQRRHGRNAIPAPSSSRDDHIPIVRPLTAAPVRWGFLYLFSLLALLSHLFLDYTNNYGLRPFFPFNPRWYAASITFIFDPIMFAMLLAAVVLPPIFRLVGSEVASGNQSRRQPFAARGWAIAALLGCVALWTLREVEHNHALQLAMSQSIAQPAVTEIPAIPNTTPTPQTTTPDPSTATVLPVYLQPLRALASPDPINPFRWYTVTDFGPVYQLAQVHTHDSTIVPDPNTHAKLAPSSALQAAESSFLGRVYLDWSPMPFLSIDNISLLADPTLPARTATVVTFRDPRFMGDTFLLHTGGRIPLTGTVDLDAQNHIIRQTLDGRVQR